MNEKYSFQIKNRDIAGDNTTMKMTIMMTMSVTI